MAGLLFSRRRGSLRDREGARPVRFQKFCQLLRGEVEITANIAVILVLQPGLLLFEKLQLFLQVCDFLFRFFYIPCEFVNFGIQFITSDL